MYFDYASISVQDLANIYLDLFLELRKVYCRQYVFNFDYKLEFLIINYCVKGEKHGKRSFTIDRDIFEASACSKGKLLTMWKERILLYLIRELLKPI